MNKKFPPVSRCTACGTTSDFIGSPNTKCHQVFGNRKCKGSMRSSMAPGDWEECPSCSATGRTENKRCEQCNGDGHLYVRQP